MAFTQLQERASPPPTNEEFWAAKRARTIQRDSESSKALAESGWRVVSLWECEINRAASNGELQDFLLSRLTTEGGVASILLNSLINAACDGTPGHPSSEQDINGVLAAVHGIRAAEMELGFIKARQRDGIERAKSKGDVYKGRKPTIDRSAVHDLFSQGIGASEIARRLKIGRASVYRVLEL